jgi:hypothetical protein
MKPPYTIIRTSIPLIYFCDFAEDYQLRPNQPRSKQWSKKQQQSFLGHAFHQMYITPIILRELDILSTNKSSLNTHCFEILDGRQRIKTIQKFHSNGFKLETPQSLKTCSTFANEGVSWYNHNMPINNNGYYEFYSNKLKNFVDYIITFNADIIVGIGDKDNPEHEKLISKIIQHIPKNK